MIHSSTRRPVRRGITLFEVVLSLVIFLLALPALNTLVQIGTRRAEETHFLAKASMECRSKLAEVTVGAEPLDPVEWSPLPDANWFWRLDVADGEVNGLKQVQVTVKFDPGTSPVQVTLSSMILDPVMRGSTQDRGLLDNSLMNQPAPMTDPAADPAAGAATP